MNGEVVNLTMLTSFYPRPEKVGFGFSFALGSLRFFLLQKIFNNNQSLLDGNPFQAWPETLRA